MAYYDIKKIKPELFITGTNQDSRLEELGDKSDSYINEQLQHFESVTPLKDVPSYLRELANNLIIAYYKERQATSQDGTAQAAAERRLERTQKEVRDYIRSHYTGDVDDVKDNAILKSDSAITGKET